MDGGNEGEMRALRPSDCQPDANIILNLRKSSLLLLFVMKSIERGINRKPLYLKVMKLNCHPPRHRARLDDVNSFRFEAETERAGRNLLLPD